MSYSATDREGALAVLRRSAVDSEDGTPNLLACEKQLGISRQTLRKWWAERGPDLRIAPAPPRATSPEPGPGVTDAHRDQARELLSLTGRESDEALLALLLSELENSESDTARARLVDGVKDLVREARPEPPPKREDISRDRMAALLDKLPRTLLEEALNRRTG